MAILFSDSLKLELAIESSNLLMKKYSDGNRDWFVKVFLFEMFILPYLRVNKDKGHYARM